MKKKVLLSAIFISAVFASSVFAMQPKSEDYVIVPDEISAGENVVVPETPVVKENNKKSIFKKSGKKSLKESDIIIEDDSKTNITNPKENVPTIEKAGELGQYILIKQDGKYGVVDSNGNIILAPVFQSIDLISQDGQELFKAKADGKYRLYYKTGNLVPEKEINTVMQNTSLLLANDLKPIFMTALTNKFVLYTKVEKEASSDSLVYEIKEIPVIKVSSGKVVDMNRSLSDISNKIDEVKTSENENYFTVGKKQYKLVKENGKLGVSDIDGFQILPVKFDIIELKKPCIHFREPVFLVSSNNLYSIHDSKGKVLAEQVFDKINVYKNGKLYTYSLENGKGILKADGKEIGSFVLTDKGAYKYQSKNKFSIIKPHVVNNLIITILNI